MVTEIVVGILSSMGGLVFGALSRQPEIEKLKAQVAILQDETSNLHEVCNEILKDLEMVKIAMQVKNNSDIINTNPDEYFLGKLIYAYAFKEYLEIKIKCLLEKKDISYEEGIFVDVFALFLENNVPFCDKEELITCVKDFVLQKHKNEIENKIVPDLKSVVDKLDVEVNKISEENQKYNSKINNGGISNDLEKLFLIDDEKIRLLYSLQSQMIQYDIDKTDNEEKKKLKKIWKDSWEKRIISGLGCEKQRITFFIKDESFFFNELNSAIGKSDSLNWLYLILLECLAFQPYFEFENSSKKIFKGLKYKHDFLKEVFCSKQNIIDKDKLKEYEKCYKNSINTLTDKNAKIITTAVVTVATIVATAGAAAYFAPEIAVAVVGGSFAELSGVALTNASLALLGGGAIAVGGAGMAGGTMVITCGGALLGATIGGISMQSTMTLLSVNGFGLCSSAMLMCFCKEVLNKGTDSKNKLNMISESLKKNILECESSLKTIKDKIDAEKDKAKKKKMKSDIKVIDRNIDYMKKCKKFIVKLEEKT